MQPRTLYTSLLMLIVIGSALGHGEEFKEKPSKRHMRELSNIRASMAKGIHRLLLSDDERVLGTVEERELGEKLLYPLIPEEVLEKYYIYPLWRLCEILYGYIKMMPKENLKDMHVKFLKVRRDVKEQLGVLL